MNKDFIKTRPIFERKIGSDAELIIYKSSIDGRMRSFSLEQYQLDAIQIILGLQWEDEGLRMFDKKTVEMFLKRTRLDKIQIEVDE